MKTKYKITTIIFSLLLLIGCEKDFLEVPPQDQLVDETYWTNEGNVRTFAFGFYTGYFTGYGSGYTWGDYFSGQTLNDDFAPSNPPQFTQQVPTSSGGWSFSWVRKANIFIERVQTVPMEQEAIEHWTGVGRFFRGLEYHDLVNRFGDVPYYDKELSEEDTEELYKPRDDRGYVMDKVLEDFQYAAQYVRANVDSPGLEVNRDVVLAYMSRVFLFEGTWQKYHIGDNTRATTYLEASKWAAEQIIDQGNYSLGNYREVFNSLSLANNPEVILYREYEAGILTHALNSYNNKEPQSGASKNAIESYLMDDGLPISVSPNYQGDMGIENVMASRDPRMYETFVPNILRLNGIDFNFSTTGFAVHKFLNEQIKDDPEGSSNLNPTDAPVIRYGEVLINYAEAAAELASIGGPALTQSDLDKSLNALRDRPGIALPHLQVSGNSVTVGGVAYDDPNRDPEVPSVIWEIRRERRIELMMEGFRLDDLRRWKKLEYSDMVSNEDINRGAWIDKANYPDSNLESITLTNGATGYIIPASASESARVFDDPKVYLSPIPLDQIKLYSDHGVDLEQNPGW
ncbi:RagB/SusD family nutrient uptake outer membrane protein [Galbibacter pacificus]|uniref:RagB/SusD family nutrient uptake outer membrane protein n=1 Tax=Galbibacter pacificus TaxID=2996052 RepID=A0ABT6FPB2_9FLAO|nr:RagB/SusD family nutrient uptake outer membrane protein [Galbibacter pacificus]MDG3581620.1 RagB/SusD family nutrient uptake outer membrane protein [Galbibacter pacificus]MDG3585098.1 RagB/SusD family nutrient uptake outer membrane protein [Galbibacter pacificus]